MKELQGKWLTSCYRVRLTDGSTRSVYATSQTDANERMRRHLTRMGSPERIAKETT